MIKKEQWVHYRALEQDPHLPQLRTAQNGGVTLFVMPFADNQLAVGVATCSPLDQFCLAKGRWASEGRVKKLRKRTVRLISNRDEVLWVWLDRIAGKAWFEACAIHYLPAPLLQRGGRAQQIIGPYHGAGPISYPWRLDSIPAGAVEDENRPRIDDLSPGGPGHTSEPTT